MSDQSTAGSTPEDDLTLEQWAAMPEDEAGEVVDGRLEEEEMPDYLHEDTLRLEKRLEGLKRARTLAEQEAQHARSQPWDLEGPIKAAEAAGSLAQRFALLGVAFNPAAMEAILLDVGADQPSTTSDREQALKKLESALTPAPPVRISVPSISNNTSFTIVLPQ